MYWWSDTILNAGDNSSFYFSWPMQCNYIIPGIIKQVGCYMTNFQKIISSNEATFRPEEVSTYRYQNPPHKENSKFGK